jgi:hypothetical protein
MGSKISKETETEDDEESFDLAIEDLGLDDE